MLKEGGGSGRVIILGVRKAESQKRSGRKLVEACFKDGSKRYVNPIIDWSESDVWDFINQENIPYCSLYDEGFKRLGCVGCPLGTKYGQRKEFDRWPKIEKAWKHAVKDAFENGKADGKDYFEKWEYWEQFWDWWITAGAHEGDPDQTIMFE